jgi:prepilin-type N-terminal cleavage/methylation domain-containing protein
MQRFTKVPSPKASLCGGRGPAAQRGFNLLEIAIVLVVVGLLLGGVMRGQELIASSRVRYLIAQQEGVRAAFYGFLDRFRSMAGDYAGASQALRCPNGASCLNGNGNGVVEDAATPVTIGGVPSEPTESLLVWMHLASAGFLNGEYRMTAGDTMANDLNSPRNPYNIYLHLGFDAMYFDSGAPAPRHNLKTGAQVPVEIIAEVDRKLDDGNGARGAFRYSTYAGNAPLGPQAPLPTYAPGQCMTTAGIWQVAQGEPNCGGASLL